jgi:hypothetical protein
MQELNQIVSGTDAHRAIRGTGFDKSEAGYLNLRHDSISKTLPLLNSRCRAGALCARQSRGLRRFRFGERIDQRPSNARAKGRAPITRVVEPLLAAAGLRRSYGSTFPVRRRERMPAVQSESAKSRLARELDDRRNSARSKESPVFGSSCLSVRALSVRQSRRLLILAPRGL